MPKLFSKAGLLIFAAVFAGVSLFAGDEAVIRNMITRHQQYALELRPDKAAQDYADDAVLISYRMPRQSGREFKNMCSQFAVILQNMKQLKTAYYNGDAASFFSIMMNTAGQKVDEVMLNELKKPEIAKAVFDSAEVKALEESFAMMDKLPELMTEAMKSFVIESVKVDGNQATVVVKSRSLDTAGMTLRDTFERSTAELVKRDGKWVIVKEVSHEI